MSAAPLRSRLQVSFGKTLPKSCEPGSFLRPLRRITIMTTTTYKQAAQRVRQLARIAAYHKGAAMTYADVANHCHPDWRPRFIADQCELAGFPVWTSAPDEAWKP